MNSFAKHPARFAVALAFVSTAMASSLPNDPLKSQVTTAAAICSGVVVDVAAERNPELGGIRSRVLVRVDEPLKGVFPRFVQLHQAGGRLEDEGEHQCTSPHLRPGETRLFFLARRPDGTLFVAGTRELTGGQSDPAMTSLRKLTVRNGTPAPGDDVRDHATTWSGPIPDAPVTALDATGLFTDSITGVPSRYLQPDRGEPIEYIVDAATLPTGMSQATAMNALSNALASWSAVTSVEFKFIGYETFAQASPNIAIKDGRLRVQLHDTFNYIVNPTTLGIGGRNYAVSGSFPAGGTGGRVGSQEFYPNNYGYVVLNHRSTSMQNPATFEEVLCHEIGHSLGLAHSSENPSEPNTVLKDAMMYYQVHSPPRGALLGTYDPPIVQKAHPTGNTPPYGYARVMDVVTSQTPANVPGVNTVSANGHDLQGDTLTVSIVSPSSSNGSFSLAGGLLRFTPDGAFSTTSRLDPAGNSFWDSAFLRFEDGTHASPYVLVRVISFNLDTRPAGAVDGMPDWWTQQYFGSSTPSQGANTRAQDDFDNDGSTNLDEWLAGTVPNSAASRLRITGFTGTTLNFDARPYEVYELMGTTDFSPLSRVANPTLPTTAIGSFSDALAPAGYEFFKVRRVP